MNERTLPTASRMIAVLIERLGGAQVIKFDEYSRFAADLPTVFTQDPKTGDITVDVEKEP